ncbi:MAG: hypothetical protein KDD70_12480, partial [Bdellovibrionales bacterium]|nr:hypothetical protein [Bdellovibrionales bacterium]
MISAQKIAATAGDSKTQVVPVSGGKLDLLSLWVELRDAQTLDSVGYLQLHCQYVWSAIRSNPFGTFATVLLIALAVFLSGTVLVIGKPTSALLFAESARLPIKVLFEPEGKE